MWRPEIEEAIKNTASLPGKGIPVLSPSDTGNGNGMAAVVANQRNPPGLTPMW
jgi:hypothetical protein